MISVVIPTYNEEKHIRFCLKSLVKCKTKKYEIIIVDAKSTDKTAEICKEYTDKILIENKKEGIAAARNKGANIAKGDIIAFLDADSIPKEGWLDYVEKAMADNVIAVSGPVEYGINWLDYIYKLLFLINLNKILFNFSLIYCNNSAWRRDKFLELGGYKNVIGEDFDLCMRARKYAKKIVIVPGMVVRLSARRFKKEGVLSTHYLWIKSNIYALSGKSVPFENYKKYS